MQDLLSAGVGAESPLGITAYHIIFMTDVWYRDYY